MERGGGGGGGGAKWMVRDLDTDGMLKTTGREKCQKSAFFLNYRGIGLKWRISDMSNLLFQLYI